MTWKAAWVRSWADANPEKAAEAKRRWREANPDKIQSAKALRRAAVEDGEVFASIEVFERDGWVCQLCHESVDPSARHPHPRTPTLDHVVPLSKGGKHTRGNSQLACLSCNLKKGNRIVEEVA